MEKEIVEIGHKNQVLDMVAISMLMVLCASWGLQQVSIKIANHGVSPVLQAGIRSLGASVFLWFWMIVNRESVFEKDGSLWWGIAAGILFSVEFILIYSGLSFTNASRAVIFLYLSPFVVALGAQIFIPSEKLKLVQIIGLVCAFSGIVIAFGESLTLPSHRMLIGDSLLAGAAVFWGATTVLIKASPLANIKPSKTLLYQLTLSALILPISSYMMKEPGITQFTPLIDSCLIYQIVWVAFITYLIWFWLISKYPASRIAAFTFLTPLFGVLAGSILLHENITIMLIMALILVATGIYLVNRPKN